MLTIQLITQLTGHQAAIYALAPAKEPYCFFSGDGNGWVVKWNLRNKDTAKLVAKVPSNIFSLHFISTHDLLVIGSMQGTLYFIDTTINKLLEPPLQLSNKSIFDIKQIGDYLYVTDGRGNINILSINSLQIIQTLNISRSSIRNIAIHPNQQTLALASSDHQVHIWEVTTRKVVQSLAHHRNSVFAAQYIQDGSYLLTASRDAHLAIWQCNKKYDLLQSLPAHHFTINSLAYSPDKQYIATGSRDKSLKIWQAKANNFRLLKVIDNQKTTLPAHNNSVNKLLWLNYESCLISASDDKRLMVWQIAN